MNEEIGKLILKMIDSVDEVRKENHKLRADNLHLWNFCKNLAAKLRELEEDNKRKGF